MSGRRANGTAGIAVQDEGPGVAPGEERADLRALLRARRRDADGGFGLGLAIGRELAAHMEGDLLLARAGPGARFVVRLPGESPPLS